MNIASLEHLLTEHKQEFDVYLRLLLKWNKTYNLTAITNPDEIWEKHFLDSIAPLPFLPEKGALLDIGTGAGFPGIPIKIVRPALSVTLLEATQKKCNFCEAVIRELGLKDIKVVHGRAEDRKTGCPALAGGFPPTKVGQPGFDVVISRATLSLKELVTYGFPYIKNRNVLFIAMKGADVNAEVKEAQPLIDKYKMKISSINGYQLPTSKTKRNILVISTLFARDKGLSVTDELS